MRAVGVLSLCAMSALTVVAAPGEAAQPIAPPTDQVSADCAAPAYATDQLVCADPVLRALDAEVADLWARLVAAGRADASVREAQSDWFRRRSLCAFRQDHYRCSENSYRTRIEARRPLAVHE
jgi:uncharacterized protein